MMDTNLLYGNLNNLVDEFATNVSKDRIKDEDNSWIFRPTFEFLSYLYGYIDRHDNTVLHVNNHYGLDGPDTEVIIHYEFPKDSIHNPDQFVNEFVQDVARYYQSDNNEVKGISIGLDETDSAYNVHVELYLTKDKKYSVVERAGRFVITPSNIADDAVIINSRELSGLSREEAEKASEALNDALDGIKGCVINE